MTRRPRIARLLDRLGDLLCAVFVDPAPPLSQAEVDASFDAWAPHNR